MRKGQQKAAGRQVRTVNAAFELCLEPGHYTVAAYADDGRRGTVDLQADGQDHEVFIYLEPELLSDLRLTSCLGEARGGEHAEEPMRCELVNARSHQCSLHAQVVGADGKPAPFAQVSIIVDRAQCYGLSDDYLDDVVNAVADARGEIGLTDLPCGGVSVFSWSADACSAEYLRFAKQDESREVRLELRPQTSSGKH